MLSAGPHVARALVLATFLPACSGGDPGELWVPVEDELLEGVNFGLVWGVGDDIWMSAEPPDDPSINTVVHFDGDRWEYVAEGQGLGEHISALWASGPDDLWVVATNRPGGDSLWHGDGSTWVQVTDAFTGLSAPAALVIDAWGSAADDVWVAAELEDGDDAVLRYDGETWQVMFQMAVEPDYAGRLLGGCSYDRDDVVLWASTTLLPESGSMSSMFRWDGAGWNEVSYGDVSLLCPQGGGAWGINGTYTDAVDPLPRDLVHSDGDGGWEPLMLFDEPSSIDDVWIDDGGEGWILGFEIPADVSYENEIAEIWRLSDGIVTPTLASGPVLHAGDMRSVWQTASGRVFAFGSEDLVLEYVGPE